MNSIEEMIRSFQESIHLAEAQRNNALAYVMRLKRELDAARADNAIMRKDLYNLHAEIAALRAALKDVIALAETNVAATGRDFRDVARAALEAKVAKPDLPL